MNFLTRLFNRKRYAFNPDYVVRPSQSILEAMEFANVSVKELWLLSEELLMEDIAKLLADEIEIGETIAVELSKVLGGAPEVWFNLSKNYHDKRGGKDA